MTKYLTLAGLFASVLFAGNSASAEGMSLEPGWWEFQATMAQGQTQTNEQCVEQDSWDPKSLTEGSEGCQVVEQDVSSNTLNFVMNCSQDGQQMTMRGEYVSHGDRVDGKMRMSMKFGDQTINQEITWRGTRVRDC